MVLQQNKAELIGETKIVTAQTKPMVWDRWQFLIGQWEAVGHGGPREGKGGFSFIFDLQNNRLRVSTASWL